MVLVLSFVHRMSLWRATRSGPFITKREQWLWVVLSRWERWKAGGLENVSSEFIVAGVTGPSKTELQRKSELCPPGPGREERMSRDLTDRARLFVVGLTPSLSVSIVRTLDFWVKDCQWILKRNTGSALSLWQTPEKIHLEDKRFTRAQFWGFLSNTRQSYCWKYEHVVLRARTSGHLSVPLKEKPCLEVCPAGHTQNEVAFQSP